MTSIHQFNYSLGWLTIVTIIVSILAILAVIYIPILQIRRATLNDLSEKDTLPLTSQLRQTIIQIIGGSALLVTFYSTANQIVKNDQDQLRSDLNSALVNLGSSTPFVRIAAIYSLTELSKVSMTQSQQILTTLCIMARSKVQVSMNFADASVVDAEKSALLSGIGQI